MSTRRLPLASTAVRCDRPACSGLLVALCALLTMSCREEKVTVPAPTSAIAGSLRASTGSAAIAGAAIVLRRPNGDSLAGAASDAAGAFRFSNLQSGTYRIAARVPPGHRVTLASDTSASVTLSAGADATVQFSAVPIVSLADTVRAGRTDTLTLANGVRVVVALPAGLPPLALALSAAPADQSIWQRPVISPAAEIVFSAATKVAGAQSRQRAASDLPVKISYALPLSGSPGAGAEARARGLFVMSGSGNPFSADLNSDRSSSANPVTGTTEMSVIGEVQFADGELQSLRLAAISATLECKDQFDMIQDKAFTGNRPLILLHGIQLQYANCDQYKDYHPDEATFKTLIAALKADATIRSTYSLYTFKYPTYAGVQNAANVLASRYMPSLTQNPARKVTIVAHSMGGLVARKYLSDYGANLVEQVITLATPHLGTIVADVGDKISTPQVEACYDQARAAQMPPRMPTLWLLTKLRPLLLQSGTQGLADLTTTSTVVDRTEAAVNLFSTLEGETSINGADHSTGHADGALTNGVMTLAECYLSLQTSGTPNDGFVVKPSAWPQWSTRQLGPFARDHIQMTGEDAQGVSDGFLPTIINYLIYPPTNPAPVLVLVGGNNQVGRAGQPLADPITVEARTAQGAVLPNVVLQIRPDPGSGVVTPSTVSTNSVGRALVSWTLGDNAGIQHLKATIGGYATATIAAYAVTTGGMGCPNFVPYVLGTSVSAVLTAADCTITTPPDTARYYEKDYAAGVPQTQAVRVQMTSAAFVPWASVQIEPSGWSTGFVAVAGSQTATTNALVAPGAFATRMLAATPRTTGSYTFSAVAIASDVTACLPFLLTHGVVTSQQLAIGDCNTGARTYDRYFVGIPPGWRIAVDMSSSNVDSYLELFRADDATRVAADDDGGGGTNAHLSFTSATNSSYYLHAGSASGTQLGNYLLSFSLVPSAAARQSRGNVIGGVSLSGVVPPPALQRD